MTHDVARRKCARFFGHYASLDLDARRLKVRYLALGWPCSVKSTQTLVRRCHYGSAHFGSPPRLAKFGRHLPPGYMINLIRCMHLKLGSR